MVRQQVQEQVRIRSLLHRPMMTYDLADLQTILDQIRIRSPQQELVLHSRNPHCPMLKGDLSIGP